jgi:hypothetical protein
MTFVFAGVFVVLVAIYVVAKRPTHEGNWRADLKQLPTITFDGSQATIHNLRCTRYGPPGSPLTASYTTRTYNLGDVTRVWFVQESFSAWRAVAHTLVSFEFADGQCLAVSIEARVTAGERYSLIRGVFNNFELMYVIGDEPDLIGRRAYYQQHAVYLYPLTLTAEDAQKLLRGMLEEANNLLSKPKFYNTLSYSCTSHLFRLFNRTQQGLIPLRFGTIVPGYSDQMLVDQGLIDQNKNSLHDVFYVSDIVQDIITNNPDDLDDVAFSQTIRKQLPRENLVQSSSG